MASNISRSAQNCWHALTKISIAHKLGAGALARGIACVAGISKHQNVWRQWRVASSWQQRSHAISGGASKAPCARGNGAKWRSKRGRRQHAIAANQAPGAWQAMASLAIAADGKIAAYIARILISRRNNGGSNSSLLISISSATYATYRQNSSA